jgi:Cu(I)/Ag(I) efflux system membrane protein CusA/SilA
MKRIAAPMVGGMISSSMLTLVVIPAIYSLWQEREVRAPATHRLSSVATPPIGAPGNAPNA